MVEKKPAGGGRDHTTAKVRNPIRQIVRLEKVARPIREI